MSLNYTSSQLLSRTLSDNIAAVFATVDNGALAQNTISDITTRLVQESQQEITVTAFQPSCE